MDYESIKKIVDTKGYAFLTTGQKAIYNVGGVQTTPTTTPTTTTIPTPTYTPPPTSSTTLTPDQVSDYYATEGKKASPIAPLDWLNKQTPNNIQRVVDAPSTGDTTAPDLPTKTGEYFNDIYTTASATNVATRRTELENTYKTQIDNLQRQIDDSKASMEELNTLQAEGVEDVGDLMTPFREQLENAERERLYITKNFEDNQRLTNELETLLTEGNELIKQQTEVTGLSSIRNPRIDKTISDVNARVGVIEATMSARNNQIGQAYNLIDRSINAISADKQDQLNYYNTLYNFYENQKDAEGNKLMTLDNEKKSYLNAQIGLLENDLMQAQDNANYIKDLMTDPDTALFMAKAGVTLNDTPEVANQKMAQESEIQEVADFKNEKLEDGYTYVPYGAGDTSFNVGGRELSFNAPPEKVGGTTQTVEEPMSTNQIEQFRRSYGWTPPFGYSESQLLQYMKDNPNATPEELEAGAKQSKGETVTETTPEPTQTVEESVEKTTPNEIIISIMDSITDEQLKLLKNKADKAGISSMWKHKTTDVKNYLNSIKDKIQTAIDSNFSGADIIQYLTQ